MGGMNAMRALIVGGLLGFLAAVGYGCGSGPLPCQSSCSGCCDRNNECQPGTTAVACGAGAHQCSKCPSGGACVDHACMVSDAGTMDAGAGGGSATGGGGGDIGGGTGTGGGGGGDDGGMDAGGGGGAYDSGVILYEPDAGTFNLSFGNCGSFVPCGGNPLGIWVYSSCCIPDTDFQGMIQKSDMYCGMGSTSITNKYGTGQGFVGFDGQNARHVVHGTMYFTANINSALCSTQFACAQIAGNLTSIGIQGSCNVVNNVCVCNLYGGIEVDDSSAYTFSGHTVNLTDANKTFDFCATNTQLIMRETTASSSTREPGYPHAGRQPNTP
jgi:hypothetical protein